MISLICNRKKDISWVLIIIFMYIVPTLSFAQEKDSTKIAMYKKLEMAMETPKINTNPGEKYSDSIRNYNMVIGADQTPGGRIWAAWVSGDDGPNGYFVIASSDDNGLTWSKPRMVIDPSNHKSGLTRRILVGNFWTDPKGRLWRFFDQSMDYFDGRSGDWYIRCYNPDAKYPKWTVPKRIWHGCTLQKPTILSSGEWLLPISLWKKDFNYLNKYLLESEKLFPELDKDRKAWVFSSTDEGKTWKKQGNTEFPNFNFDEHIIVELNDGRLWMTARTKKGIYETYSSDKGKTWSKPIPSNIINTNSRHFMRKLSSGSILLVKNGPIDKNVGRYQLMAFISTDDGKTWKGGLELESIDRNCSYPDGFESKNGQIFIIYDHERSKAKEILMARFTEKDILAKKLIDKNSKLRMLVNKARGEK